MALNLGRLQQIATTVAAICSVCWIIYILPIHTFVKGFLYGALFLGLIVILKFGDKIGV